MAFWKGQWNWQTPGKTDKEKKEKTQSINIRNESGTITTDPTDIKRTLTTSYQQIWQLRL